MRVGDAELAVAPRVVLGKTGRHAEQVAEGDFGCVGGGRFDRAEFREVFLNGVLERQFAGVAEFEDGQRSEGLRHRGDAEGGARIGGNFFLEVGEADVARVEELSVEHDAPDQARRVFCRRVVGVECRDLGEEGGDFFRPIGVGETSRGVALSGSGWEAGKQTEHEGPGVERRFHEGGEREEGQGSTTTGRPVHTRSRKVSASQFARRKQPCDSVRPICSGFGVPWMP